jgi:hypothetical protein
MEWHRTLMAQPRRKTFYSKGCLRTQSVWILLIAICLVLSAAIDVHASCGPEGLKRILGLVGDRDDISNIQKDALMKTLQGYNSEMVLNDSGLKLIVDVHLRKSPKKEASAFLNVLLRISEEPVEANAIARGRRAQILWVQGMPASKILERLNYENALIKNADVLFEKLNSDQALLRIAKEIESKGEAVFGFYPKALSKHDQSPTLRLAHFVSLETELEGELNFLGLPDREPDLILSVEDLSTIINFLKRASIDPTVLKTFLEPARRTGSGGGIEKGRNVRLSSDLETVAVLVANLKHSETKKHRKATSHDEAREFSSRAAQYFSDLNVYEVEKNILRDAKAGVVIRHGGALHKYAYINKAVGFDSGQQTNWIRVEVSGGVFHGHPMKRSRVEAVLTPSEINSLLKNPLTI